jgi:hypothetical protein
MDGMAFDMRQSGAFAMLKQVLVEGWRLWMRKPWLLGLLTLLPILVEVVIQPIPRYGMLSSKILANLLIGVIWLALDQVARTDRVDFKKIVNTLQRNAVAWIALTLVGLIVIFGFQVWLAWVIYGQHALEWLLLGDMSTHPSQSPILLLAIIPAGVITGTLIMMAIPLVLLCGMSALKAVGESLRIVFAHLGFFALFAIVTAVLVTAGLVTIIGLLLIVPWMSACGYAAYRLLVENRAQPVAL